MIGDRLSQLVGERGVQGVKRKERDYRIVETLDVLGLCRLSSATVRQLPLRRAPILSAIMGE